MRSATEFYSFTALLLAVAGCQPAETPAQMQARMDQESAAARQQIEAAQPRFERFIGAGQADSITAFYTDNATVMPPNEKAVTGRDNLLAFWTGMLGMGQWTLDIRTSSVTANGPIAVETGTYVLSFKPGPNAMPGVAPADTGKFMAHWHQVGGQWKIAEDTWNSDLPLTPPAPARRR